MARDRRNRGTNQGGNGPQNARRTYRRQLDPNRRRWADALRRRREEARRSPDSAHAAVADSHGNGFPADDELDDLSARTMISDSSRQIVPCVWFDPEAFKKPFPFNQQHLASRTIEITLPLSPNHCALLSWFDCGDSYMDVDENNLDQLNRVY